MQAVQFTSPHTAVFIDVPDDPPPGPGEALVRTRRMGVCGTDISSFLGKFPFFAYPRIPGHELGLEVVAVGDGVAGTKPGDKCALEPYFNDPGSAASRRGLTNCCPGVKVLGVHMDGGLRQGAYLVPAHKLHPGNDLEFEQLALVETLAIGRHAVQRANPRPGETVLVIGAGPIGLACLEFLKLLDGVRTLVLEMAPARLEFCTSHLGVAESILHQADGSHAADLAERTGGQLADVVIDATGSAASMSTAFNHAAVGGRVVYVGITTSELCFPHAPVFHRRELTLLASRNAVAADFPAIIKLIRADRIRTGPWITRRIPFGLVPDELPRLADPANGVIKAVIEVQGGN
jgi:2-desacetyl-2-hydroxyethyl bacteriochlorophyllide A dehydrogenase